MLTLIRAAAYVGVCLCSISALAEEPIYVTSEYDAAPPMTPFVTSLCGENFCGDVGFPSEGCCDTSGCCEIPIDECSCHGYGICHHDDDNCEGKYAKHLHSTCDMYPHYAYAPENHGYYYFRPYNYIHVLEHVNQSLVLSDTPWNPYSVAIFDAIPQPIAPMDTDPSLQDGMQLPPRRDLPLLEELLDTPAEG